MKKIILNYLGLFMALILLSSGYCEKCNEEFQIDFTYVVEEYNRVVFTSKVYGGGNIEGYEWVFNHTISGYDTSSERNPVHYFDEAGEYAVKFSVITDYGSESITKTITVETFEEDYGDGS